MNIPPSPKTKILIFDSLTLHEKNTDKSKYKPTDIQPFIDSTSTCPMITMWKAGISIKKKEVVLVCETDILHRQ